MTRVFISHASADEAVAVEVCDWLRNLGHEPFLARDLGGGIPVGEDWKQRLYQELRSARAVVCIVSRAYVASNWCAAEVGIADSLGCRLIPLQIEGKNSATPWGAKAFAQLNRRAYADIPWVRRILTIEAGVVHPLMERLQHADYRAGRKVWQKQVREALLRAEGWTPAPLPSGNPYPGLTPFTRNYARTFFGRHGEIREFTGELRSPAWPRGQVLAVSGRSGCGKSSLLRAGLLPALSDDDGFLLTRAWTPRDDPLGGLAGALAAAAKRVGQGRSVQGRSVQDIRAVLEADDNGLRTIADDLLTHSDTDGARLLLAVDQAEELFTPTLVAEHADADRLAADRLAAERLAAERLRFGRLVANAADKVLLVVTVRSVFLDDLRGIPGLENLEIKLLGPLGDQALQEVIERPARLAGLPVDPLLAPEMINDFRGGEALPLLAFTLHQLAAGGSLTVEQYEALRGDQGALARHADATLAAAVEASTLTQNRVIACLVRLVDVDEFGRRTRRHVRLADLPTPERTALGVFLRNHLLVGMSDEEKYGEKKDGQGGGPEDGQDGGQSGGQVWVALAHQAMTRWKPLDEAVKKQAASPDMIRSVKRATAEWENARWPDSHLWPKQRLAAVGEALGVPDIFAVPLPNPLPSSVPLRLDAGSHAFLSASAERVRRSRRLRYAVTMGLSMLLVLVLAATGFAVWQQQFAERQHRLTVGRALLVEAAALRDRAPRVALALTIKAYELAPELTAADDALLSIQATYYSATLNPQIGELHAVAFSPDGKRIAAAGHAKALVVWEMPGRDVRLIPMQAPVNTVAFSRDGRMLAAGDQNGAVGLWDARTLEKMKELPGDADAVHAVAFSPDSRLLAVAQGNTVVLRDVQTLTELAVLGGAQHGGLGDVYGLAFNPVSGILATASGDGQRSVRFWDLQNLNPGAGAAPRHVPGYPGPALTAAFSSDGRKLATGSSTGAVNIWDAASGNPIAAVTNSTERVRAVVFSPDGRTLATAGDDGSVRLLDARSHRLLTTLTGPTREVVGLAFSPDSQVLASAGLDGLVGLWHVSGPAAENQPAVFNAAVSGPGGVLATAGQDHTIRLWDVRTDTGPVSWATLGSVPMTSTAAGPGRPFAMAFDPAGGMLAAPTGDSTAALWLVNQPGRSVSHHGFTQGERNNPVRAVAFSGSRLLASASRIPDGDVDLWDTATLEVNSELRSVQRLIDGTINAVAVSPAGPGLSTPLVATGGGNGNGNVVLTPLPDPNDPNDPKRQPTILLGETRSSPVQALAFSPGGNLLASAHDDGAVRLWDTGQSSRDAGRYRLQATLSGSAGPAVAVSFSGDATVLAAVNADGVVRLWDVAEPATASFGTLEATLTGRPGTTSVAFPPDGDGTMFATADQDGTPVLWDTAPERVHARLCAGPQVAITHEEWSLHVPDEPYQPVCQ